MTVLVLVLVHVSHVTVGFASHVVKTVVVVVVFVLVVVVVNLGI